VNTGECVTTIDLLRHGACEGGEIFRGSIDVELTAAGREQMRAALADMEGWQRIVCSSLQRCCRFAAELAGERGLPLQVCPDLREIHFGDWEGRRHSDVMREEGERLAQFWRDPLTVTPPNGESMAQFRERVVAAMHGLLDEHRGRHLLLVTHGAVIRLLLTEWLQMPMTAFSNIAVPYASFTRCRIFEREGSVPWVQLCLHRGDVV
jgi:broad specificity phosphatase PhoE